MTNQSLAEIPVLQATEQAFESINLDDKLQVAYIECKSVNMPEYFRTDKFTIQFMTRGTLTAEINHQHFTIHAPAIIFISPNYILHPIHVSEESLMYVLSFSIDFGNDMNLNAGNDIYNKAYIRPVMSINENQLNICLQYLSLLRNIIQDSSICNSYKIANSIVRSLIYYMADFYVQLFNQQHALSFFGGFTQPCPPQYRLVCIRNVSITAIYGQYCQAGYGKKCRRVYHGKSNPTGTFLIDHNVPIHSRDCRPTRF